MGPRVGLDTGEEKNAHLCRDLNHISVVVQPSHYTASFQSVMTKKLKGNGSNSICHMSSTGGFLF